MSLTVLIVEDNEKNLKLFKLIVTSMGYRVLTATNSRDGISIAGQEKPDLILMDIQMAGMDGISALKQLKAGKETCHIPVVALTSCVMKGDRERLLAEGFAHYIPKPIDKKSFIADVRRIAESRT